MDIWDIIGVCITGLCTIFSTVFTLYKNGKTQKKQQEHERALIELQEKLKKDVTYEIHSVTVISSFLSKAKIFLGDPDCQEAYNDFSNFSAEVLMYLPDTHIDYAKELTNRIDNIHKIQIGYDDGSFERRRREIESAFKFHSEISEKFREFGLKKPN
ncbi:MAG: hypothetical protein E7577_02505 [Ruminococcaceae bacterium]|nr:hypothetical protein [Oscillospiraceae bacterium]